MLNKHEKGSHQKLPIKCIICLLEIWDYNKTIKQKKNLYTCRHFTYDKVVFLINWKRRDLMVWEKIAIHLKT